MDIKAFLPTGNISPPAKADLDRALLDLLKAALSPGDVIDVKTAFDPKGQSGILFNGRFIPAELPRSLKPNQEIRVQVQEINDSLILKLISVDTAPSQPELAKVFKNIIETAFPDISFEEIKKAVEQQRSDLPPQLAPHTLRTDAQQTSEGQKLLARAAAEKLIITTRTLDSVQNTAEAMSRVFGGGAASGLKALIKQIERDDGSGLTTNRRLEVLKTIEQHLGFLLDLESPLSFDPGAEEPTHQLPERLRLYLAISELAVSSGSQGTLQEIAKHLSAIKRDTNPLVVLFKALTTLGMVEQSPKTQDMKRAAKFVQQFIEDLKQARDQKFADKDIRRILREKHEGIRQLFGGKLEKAEESASKGSALSLLRSIDALASAQDALRQVNPLMREIGEPALFFLPLIFERIFVKSEFRIAHEPDLVDEDGDKAERASQTGFTRFTFKTSLPVLGDVRVDAAYGKKEIYLSFIFQNPESAALAAEKLPMLEKQLEEMGFNKRSLKAESGLADIPPSWFEALSERKVVA